MDPRETGLAPSVLSTRFAFRGGSLANFCGLGLFWGVRNWTHFNCPVGCKHDWFSQDRIKKDVGT
jgi:hypothetical protein